ncbi:MAG: AbrB/MazE/SpoVT family DNA-binding domain-containing protein [Oscillibacter sp.]|nr:AbrB/MazE/SpoVT family DNA-binding domain-containing protein [Oscillibacter sp.]MBQ9617656.1 AbrB/MazE/SpoVT family DNA-binding domain-containing protein [Oscillibacter sp.]
METAKVFESGRSQAVRIPKRFRFSGNEVFIQKIGDAVLLTPKDKAWETFLEGLNGFTDDFFQNERQQGAPQVRESL